LPCVTVGSDVGPNPELVSQMIEEAVSVEDRPKDRSPWACTTIHTALVYTHSQLETHNDSIPHAAVPVHVCNI